MRLVGRQKQMLRASAKIISLRSYSFKAVVIHLYVSKSTAIAIRF